jgi:hypothetical protein
MACNTTGYLLMVNKELPHIVKAIVVSLIIESKIYRGYMTQY